MTVVSVVKHGAKLHSLQRTSEAGTQASTLQPHEKKQRARRGTEDSMLEGQSTGSVNPDAHVQQRRWLMRECEGAETFA